MRREAYTAPMSFLQKHLGRGLGQLLWRQFCRYWWWYLLGLLLLWGTHECQSYLPFLAQQVGENFAQGKSSVPAETFLALALGILLLRTFSRLLIFTPARYLERDLRYQLVRSLEETSPLRLEKHHAGELFTVTYADIQQIRALTGFAVLQLLNFVVALIVLFPKLFEFNPHLLWACSPMFAGVVLVALITYWHQPYFRKIQDYQAQVQNFLIESYLGKQSIKNYQAEKNFVEHFRDDCRRELAFFYKASRGPSIGMPLLPLSMGLSLVWGAAIIQQEQLGASSLIFFSGFLFLLMGPMMFLSWIGVVFSRSFASWQRLQALLEDMQRPSQLELQLEKNHPQWSHSFQLLFWDKSLQPLSITAGKWHALVGKTGVGKSFLLVEMAQVLKLHQQKVSYVGQAPYIYNDNIQNNVFLGRKPQASELELCHQLLDLFGLSLLTEKAHNLLALELGENGKRLSGGQAKRLCLVRSLMSESDYFLWDDPFSSVDLILEKQILGRLKENGLFKDRTFILTTHRLSTVRFCDYTFYIERSKGVRESGETSNLLQPKRLTGQYFQDQMV